MTTQPFEQLLRPKRIQDYIGQSSVKKALRLFLDAVHSRNQINEHVLLYGPPGIGKTTLAAILAEELKGDLRITSGPAIDKAGDLAAILSNLKDRDVLFIDEIHRLHRAVEESLYPVLEEFHLDIVIGKGPSARTVRLPVPRITIIGATTRVASLSAPLRDRFGMILRLDFYSDAEMSQIIGRTAKVLKIPLHEDLIKHIVIRSRGTPRLANRIMKRLADLHQVEAMSEISHDHLEHLFELLQLDDKGLQEIDKKYLELLINTFEGGPVGVSTLAMALSEDIRTLEEFIEPYLLKIGFIKRTAKGRVATSDGIEHLKRS